MCYMETSIRWISGLLPSFPWLGLENGLAQTFQGELLGLWRGWKGRWDFPVWGESHFPPLPAWLLPTPRPFLPQRPSSRSSVCYLPLFCVCLGRVGTLRCEEMCWSGQSGHSSQENCGGDATSSAICRMLIAHAKQGSQCSQCLKGAQLKGRCTMPQESVLHDTYLSPV